MTSWKTHLRITGLIILLNVIPFVRGCDDVEGLHETAGFPVPYFAYSTSSFDLSAFHPIPFGINIALLCVVVCLFAISRSKIGTVLVGWRFLLAVGGLAVLLKFGNLFVFIPLMLICISIPGVFDDNNMVLTMDLLARLLFLGLLAICYFIAKGSKKRDSNERPEDIVANRAESSTQSLGQHVPPVIH
jgi:hypothetical protein